MALLAHLDLDAFFASVELRSNPALKGKPVVVAGSSPRSVVTTASYEARRFGVGSAMSAERARALCPGAVFIEPDIGAYRQASREIMEIISSRVARLERLGLDEAYLDLSAFDNPEGAMRALQSEIWIETGIGASIGIGDNRLVAKLASDVNKPRGLTVLDRRSAYRLFRDRPPRVIPGIGPKTEQQLLSQGIHSVDQLARFPVSRLQLLFGPRRGQEIHNLSVMDASSTLSERREPKSESRETTFAYDLDSLSDMHREMRRLSLRLAEDLAGSGRRGRTVQIKVRLSDWTTVTRSCTMPSRVSSGEAISTIAAGLLQEYNPAQPVRLLGVSVSGLQEPRQLQLPLPRWMLEPHQA